MFIVSHTATDSKHAELIGYHSLDGADMILLSLIIDAILFCVTLIALLIISRSIIKERPSIPVPHELAYKSLLFLMIFICGVTNPSFLSAPYFICFTIYLWKWASSPEIYGVEIPNINPFITLYVSSHIIFTYIYQFKDIENSVSDESADMLGMFLTNALSTIDIPAVVTFGAEIILFILISMADEEREAVKLARETTDQLLRLASQSEFRRQRSETAFMNNNNNNNNNIDDPNIDLSPFTRDESARHFLNRLIRTHGRFLCLVALVISAFLNPTWLSAGMLALFALGITLRRASFDRLAPLILLYTMLIILLQYLFTIPHFLPKSVDLEMIGLSRHSPYPIYYLVIGYLPILVLAGYTRLKVISSQDLYFYDVLNATAVGDMQLLRRAIEQNPDIVHKRTQSGQTVLHIAAAHGQTRAASLLLDHKAIPMTQDRNGNTPLHLSHENLHDETSIVILNHPKVKEYRDEMFSAKNKLDLCFNEMEHSATAIAKASLFRIYKFIEVMSLKHADKLSLSVLFVAGLDSVNIFNSGYVLFFMAFFPFPKLAQKGWILLVIYASIILLLQYSWSVYFASGNNDEKLYTWASTWGFVHGTNLWKDLFLYYAVLILSALQLSVYRSLSTKQDLLNQVQQGRFFESKFINRFLVIISNVLKVNGLPLCYILFVIVALWNSVTVVKMGYLLLLILCFLVHQLAPTSNKFWRNFWILVVFYTTLVLMIIYISQFQSIQTYLQQHWPKSWEKRMPINAFGLQRHTGRTSLLSFLLLPAAVYVATVLELRVLWDEPIKSIFEDTHNEIHSRHSVLTEPLLYSKLDDLYSRSHHDQEELLATRKNLDSQMNIVAPTQINNNDDSKAWFEKLVSRMVHNFTSVIVHHVGKVLAIFIWITISAIESANALNGGYLILLILFLPIKRGRFLWIPIMFYATIVLLIRYSFQFPEPSTHIDDKMRWIGIENYHNQLFRHLLAEIIILSLCTIQRYSQRVLESAIIAEQQRRDEEILQNNNNNNNNDDHKYNELDDEMIQKNIPWTQQIIIFLSTTWLWLKYGINSIYDLIGMQITLTMLLLDAFARCNALSIIQVFAVMYYLIYGRERLIRWWKVLGFLMFFALVGQYFLAMGPRPGNKFPWSTWRIQYSRWLLLSGYSSVDLNWDFFALLALVVQTRHFNEYRRRTETSKHRSALDLPPDINLDHPSLQIKHGDPNAWYNTFFDEFSFYAYTSLDKIIIIFIFYAGTRKPAVLNIGYVMMSLAVLMRKGIINANFEQLRSFAFEKYQKAWYRIAIYNGIIMMLQILYQIPWIPNEYYDSPVVRWERLVGLNQYTASSNANVASRAYKGGAIYAILIFLFIDLMLLAFSRSEYDIVLTYYRNNRLQAEFRGPESAQQRKLKRITQLARLMNQRKFFRQRLFRVQARMHEFGNEVGDMKELFPDTEVWPTKPPDDQKMITDDKDEWNDDPLPPEMVGLLSRDALEEFAPQLKASGIILDNDKNIDDKPGNEENDLLDVIENTNKDDDNNNDNNNNNDDESWIKSAMNTCDLVLRRYLCTRIDMTLWMMKEKDSNTGIYIDTQPPLSSLSTLSLFRRYLTSNSEIICYILFMINLYSNGSIIELFIPVLIFSYALMQSPRAPKGFWRFSMTYMGVIVTLKFLFQLEAFCVTVGHHHYSLQPSPYCATNNYGYTSDQEIAPDYLLGIYKTEGNKFFGYIFWDLMCLVACVWHRMLMISKGVWYQNEENLGDNILQQQLPYRYSKSLIKDIKELNNNNEQKVTSNKKRTKTMPAEYLEQSYAKASQGAEDFLVKMWNRFIPTFIRDYYFAIIPRNKDSIYVIKPGQDYYGVGFVFELISALYLLFYYPRMATTSQSTVASALSSNMFSGYMVLGLLCQMIFITLDRVFYLYRSLRWKIILQYLTLIYWLYLMFISWPKASQLLFTENAYLRFFFFLKGIYFTLGALQIKYGYPSVEKTGFQYIMRKPGILRAYMFRLYRALPFVFEMRSLLDWMAHESSLDLWEHLKLEDVHANMFLAQCDIIYRKMHPRGTAQPGYMRFLNGALIFALLMLVIFLPLIFFSSANPATEGNPVEAVSIAVSVVGPAGTYRLLTISSIASLQQVDDDTFSNLKGERIIADDAQKNVQNITLVPWADRYWDISSLSRDALMSSLRKKDIIMKIQITYSFTREKPTNQRISTDDNIVLLNQTQQEKLADIIDQKSAAKEMIVPKLIPQYLRLPSNGGPIILTDNRLDTIVRMEPPNARGESFWQVYTNEVDDIGPVFITISNPVFQNPLGLSTYAFSIVGLYSLVVLTVGRLVRLNFGGLMFLIPFEDLHDVDDLVSICEGVLIARYTHQYMKEEKLYRQLIWIYRTPPLLRRVTRRIDE